MEALKECKSQAFISSSEFTLSPPATFRFHFRFCIVVEKYSTQVYIIKEGVHQTYEQNFMNNLVHN